MLTELDENKGLVKVYWPQIRNRVKKVEPTFASIVDELNVNTDFPLYLAYYPFGALKGDTKSTFFPTLKNGFYRLSDPNAPKEVIKHLGYGKNSAPLAMLLDKNLELFIDLKDEEITIPRVIYTPGSFFPFARILSRKSSRTYAPNNVLTLTSGVRSIFMLPNIGCSTHYAHVQRDFNIKSSPPKSLYRHWYVFKEIINSEVINCDWRSCVVYFSQNWLDKLESDKAWLRLKLYFHELAWQYFEYQRNNFYYDISFSVIQKKRNLKPNPYLVDTARHLFNIALGAAPGYIPSSNNNSLPVNIIQNVFIESYGLKNYFPTILQPTHFKFEQDEYPIYYSLQHPSTHMFSPKSRKVASTLAEMRELEYITRIFTFELARNENMCSDTIINKICKHIEFDFFHSKPDQHRIIQPTLKIPVFDKRFMATKQTSLSAGFAGDGAFVRGCISIKNKN